MSKDNPSHAATDEPWKYPGQSSQDPNTHPDPDVLEKERKKKAAQAEQPETVSSPTSTRPR